MVPLTATQQIDRALEALEKSNIAFNTPQQMQLGETKTIELRLSPSASVEESSEQIREPGQIESAEEILTAPEMQARLTGQAFKIEALSDEKQAVSYREPTI